MAEFVVTPSMLTSAAGNIRKHKQNFDTQMNQIDQEMRRLKGRWESDAADKFIAKFNKLRQHFTTYTEVMESYAKFLNQTAEDYTTSEKNIAQATSELFG